MADTMQMWRAWFALATEAAVIGFEAQRVIGLRMMRLAAGGAVGQREARRMVTEKAAALVEAQTAAAAALMTGGTGKRATKKALGVYGKRVRRNRRRLSR